VSKQTEKGMAPQISQSGRRLVVALAALTAGVLVFWGIRNALAVYYSGLGTLNGYQKATQLEPENELNWYALGRYWQFNIENPDLNLAISAYHKALALNPRSAGVWLDLASAYESENDINAARTAFLQAKRVYPASADVSWRYGNFLLRQNEKMDGFQEIHHSVEADPTRGLEAFLVCRHVEQDLDLLLDRVLPPVASIYLEVIWQLTDDRQSDQALNVWSKLVALQPKLSTREVFFFVDGLLANRRTIEAKTVWRQAVALMVLPKMQDPPSSLIWDGGFETDATGGGLAWRIQPSRNIMIGYDRKVRHSGMRALRIDFGARENSDFAGVCQRVVVEPKATYELSAWLRTQEIPPGRGIFLKLTESGIPWNQWNQSAITPELAGTNGWTRVSTRWVSSDQSRLAEVCLSRLSGLESEKMPVTAWVDDVSLLKLE
jgi:tetratricopeptide (TPR) repeat protein